MAVIELNRVGPESAAVPLRGIREALHRLRAVESTLQMLDSVTAEVCRSCGFDRCVFFRLDGASLTPERAHFAGDPHWQDDWLDSARSHPVVLDARDPEINLLRRQVAVLAIDARESAHVEIPGAPHGLTYSRQAPQVRAAVSKWLIEHGL